jgi:hypothetical protein
MPIWQAQEGELKKQEQDGGYTVGRNKRNGITEAEAREIGRAERVAGIPYDARRFGVTSLWWAHRVGWKGWQEGQNGKIIVPPWTANRRN